jgi:hypothetical protein
LRIVAGIGAALFEQVVLDLLEDEPVEVVPRPVPVRGLAGFEADQFDRKSCRLGAHQRCGDRVRIVSLLVECVLELVVGQRLSLAVVALGDRLEKRLARRSQARRSSTTTLLIGAPSARVVSWWPGAGASGRTAEGRRPLPSIWMAQREPVVRRLRLHARLLDPLHEPLPASDQRDRPRARARPRP